MKTILLIVFALLPLVEPVLAADPPPSWARLDWSSATIEPGGFSVWRRPLNSGTDEAGWVLVATLPKDVRTWQDENVEAGHVYEYRVTIRWLSIYEGSFLEVTTPPVSAQHSRRLMGSTAGDKRVLFPVDGAEQVTP